MRRAFARRDAEAPRAHLRQEQQRSAQPERDPQPEHQLLPVVARKQGRVPEVALDLESRSERGVEHGEEGLGHCEGARR